nr:hypothetical protein [Amycolatopsis sulphurea]
MTVTRELLAEPLKLRCGAVLPHRLAKSALSEQLGDARTCFALPNLGTRWRRASGDRQRDGRPGRARRTAQRRRADRAGCCGVPAVAQAVEGTDAQLWVQPNHPGRQSPRYLSRQPVAPSAVPFGNRGVSTAFAEPRALTGSEIERIVARFALSAKAFVEAGFAGGAAARRARLPDLAVPVPAGEPSWRRMGAGP